MVLPTTFNESQYVEMREEPVDSKHSILKRSAPPVQDYASNIITVEPQVSHFGISRQYFNYF